MRELNELIRVDGPAWPGLRDLFASSRVPVRVLPVDTAEARRSLMQLQITAESNLGSLVLNSGGLVVDDGWVRVFGGGDVPSGAGSGTGSGSCTDTGAGAVTRMPSLARVNEFPETPDPAWHPASGLVVAHDVLGGVFALNGRDPAAAGRPGAPGHMTYFAPDTLAWESLSIGHSRWLAWLLSDRLELFYDNLRWPGWREEAAALSFSQGIAVYPFLWSNEAHADLAATTRTAVPMREVLDMSADSARKLGFGESGFLGRV